MVIELHRDYILETIENAASLEEQSVAMALLTMYNNNLLSLSFNEEGEVLWALRDNIDPQAWEIARKEWGLLDPESHTALAWENIQ